MKDIAIFAGLGATKFGEKIAAELDMPLGSCYHHMFPSGEHFERFEQNIRGKDIYLIQSTCNPAHDRFVQLCIMADAAKRASAGRITAVLPYTGYLRQDRKTQPRVPITAKWMANVLTVSGVNRVLGMDFHCDQGQGFFDIPVDHLYAMPVFINYIKSRMGDDIDYDNVCIVAPDTGGIKRALAYAKALNVPKAIVSKDRKNDTSVEVTDVIGDVKGKNCIMIDDLTESCGTLLEAASALRDRGAVTVEAYVTHGLFTGVAFERLAADRKLKSIHTTDTVDFGGPSGLPINIHTVAPLFAQAIRRIHHDESVTSLFKF